MSNLSNYLGNGEQAVDLDKAVEPFLHSLWLVAAAARAHAYGSPKPDVHLIGVDFAAGPQVIDVLAALDFVDDGHGNWTGTVDGRTTTFFGINIGHYLTNTVFAGDGIAIRLDSGAAVVTPEFWVREADYQLRPYSETGDEAVDAKLKELFDATKAELECFKMHLTSEADRLTAMGISVDSDAKLKATVETAVQQIDVGSNEQQLELDLAGKN